MGHDAEFEEFWKKYPRKIGKLLARKAYATARKQATQQELLDGVEAYIKHKPGYADFAHPGSWLRAGRWMDEWEAPPKPMHAAPLADWWDECQRLHGRRCNGQQGHATQMYIDRHKAATA
jgi:hypothetical protein